MPHVILVLVVSAAVVAVARWWWIRRNRPEARLRRDFRRLQSMILSGMERSERAGAKALLGASEEHINRLLRAREQHRVLSNMAHSAQELTGQSKAFNETRAATDAFDREVAQSLSRFLADLGRIATVIGLRQDDPLSQLRAFTEELEQQRNILLELSRELASPPNHDTARRASIDPERLAHAQETPKAEVVGVGADGATTLHTRNEP
ncbi:MAG: hypothetical protein AAFX99_07045 [Myxococcota bacterium]